MCAAGVGALQSLVNRLRKRVPGEKKISVLFEHPNGSVDWYPPDQMNPRGVLLLPKPFEVGEDGERKWEFFCLREE